jgi:hypothetical protein
MSRRGMLISNTGGAVAGLASSPLANVSLEESADHRKGDEMGSSAIRHLDLMVTGTAGNDRCHDGAGIANHNRHALFLELSGVVSVVDQRSKSIYC